MLGYEFGIIIIVIVVTSNVEGRHSVVIVVVAAADDRFGVDVDVAVGFVEVLPGVENANF